MGWPDGYRKTCDKINAHIMQLSRGSNEVSYLASPVTGGGVTAGIDFALALVARLTDTATAQTIQLALEYNPAPPFAAGAPESAGTDIVAAYRARADRLAPYRAAELKAAATRLGFST